MNFLHVNPTESFLTFEDFFLVLNSPSLHVNSPLGHNHRIFEYLNLEINIRHKKNARKWFLREPRVCMKVFFVPIRNEKERKSIKYANLQLILRLKSFFWPSYISTDGVSL